MSTVLSSPTSLQLEISARIVVQAWSLAHGVTFSHDALSAIHGLITEGAQKIVALGDEANHRKIFEAQKNFTEFLFKITEATKAAGFANIEQSQVEDTQSSFCPVYPFS